MFSVVNENDFPLRNLCPKSFITQVWKKRAPPVAQMVKHQPAVQETWVQSPGWEYPLGEEMATYSSILAWEIPWTEEPGGLQSRGSQKSWTWLSNWAGTHITDTQNWMCSTSVQFSSVAQSCPTLCNPINRSTPGFPVHHQLPEFTQTYVHQVDDAFQPSHPLSSPSPAPNPSQHQGLFQWVSSLHEVAKKSIGVSASASVLPMNTQDGSPLGWTGWICLQSKGLSRVFSNTTVQKHQFFGTQLSSQSNSHIHTWPLEKP